MGRFLSHGVRDVKGKQPGDSDIWRRSHGGPDAHKNFDVGLMWLGRTPSRKVH